MTRKREEATAMNAPPQKMWDLSKIKPYPNNPRTHPEGQITLLATLMKTHGVDQPIVVDEDGVIIKGHGRRLAAIEAGFKQFPVVQHLGLSEEDKRAVRLADNSVALLSGWEPTLLRVELTDLSTAGYDMPLLGFDDVNLVSFMSMGGSEGSTSSSIGNLAERFGIAPFTTLNAREGWWQDRKRAWLAIGIQSELGRGENGSPGGSPRPVGDGSGRPIGRRPNAIPGGAPMPLDRAKDARRNRKNG